MVLTEYPCMHFCQYQLRYLMKKMVDQWIFVKDRIILMIQEHIQDRDLSGMPDSDKRIHIDQI